MNPEVSIVLLCYNQAPYVAEAMQSVWGQTYANIQLLVVDDASTDGSREVISSLLKSKPGISFIALPENRGNCAAFNLALKRATGKYVIDLAADDVLMLNRVEEQVRFFESLSEEYGVVYSNARYIDKEGKFLKNHFAPAANPPQGNVYVDVIRTFFIPPPAMMIRKSVLDDLGGYDEALAYEDFDFWVRSARKFKYAYQPLILTSIRKLASSLSAQAYKQTDRQLLSTSLVCKKILALNKTEKENNALKQRLRYESRQAVFSANFTEADIFLALLASLGPIPLFYKILKLMSRHKIKLAWGRRLYLFLLTKFFAPKTHLQ